MEKTIIVKQRKKIKRGIYNTSTVDYHTCTFFFSKGQITTKFEENLNKYGTITRYIQGGGYKGKLTELL